MCQVQQELNRFFIAGDFWYQIRQVSVGCGELSPRENNRPMILRNHPIQPFFLLFSLLTSEDSRIWRKNMVTYKLYPINVWYGVLQTLHSFSRLLDALLLLSGKIWLFLIISVLPHYFIITSQYLMYYTGINLNACIPEIRDQTVGTQTVFSTNLLLEWKFMISCFGLFIVPDGIVISHPPSSLRKRQNSFHWIFFFFFPLLLLWPFKKCWNLKSRKNKF